MAAFANTRSLREAELRSFLKGLEAIESEAKNAEKKDQLVSVDFLKIAKASAFLLIYNYVEGVFVDALNRLHDSIHDTGVTYQTLRNELKGLWIEAKLKELQSDPKACHDKYVASALEIVDAVASGKTILLTKNSIGASGTLEHDSIIKICGKRGIKLSSKADQLGEDLIVVKNHRNSLAHGSALFSETGRQYTVSDLARIAEKTIKYIQHIEDGIDKYAGDRRYSA